MKIPNKNYSDLFLRTTDVLLDIEGGRSNDPNDHGGATNYGISDGRDGKLDGLIDLDLDGIGDIDPYDLTPEQAKYIYWNEYWLANHCDQLPVMMAVYVFDAAVNHRPGIGAKLLQTRLNVRADGIIGPVTTRAAELNNNTDTLARLFADRASFFASIVTADSSQASYLNGWFKRLFILQQFILSLDALGR